MFWFTSLQVDCYEVDHFSVGDEVKKRFITRRQQVDPKDPSKIVEENVTTMIFPLGDILRCSAVDTDLEYAAKGA
jgi:hypothetical protein